MAQGFLKRVAKQASGVAAQTGDVLRHEMIVIGIGLGHAEPKDQIRQERFFRFNSCGHFAAERDMIRRRARMLPSYSFTPLLQFC